jgi:hypothetical protein
MKFLRIKFVIPRGYSFANENNYKFTLVLNQGTLTFSIEISENDPYRTYVFKSNDFNFDIPEETIQNIHDALYLLCVEFDIGILLTPDLTTSFIPKSAITEMKGSGSTVVHDFFGVKLIPSGTLIASIFDVKVSLASNIKYFEGLLNKYVRLKYKKSDALIRALEIYNSSFYISGKNQSARFILLMSSIETLIVQPKVSKRLQRSLDTYIKRVKRLSIENEERESVIGSLTQLKEISISRSGKYLVRHLLDDEKLYNGFLPVTFFNKAYNLRSRFVHYGITKTKDLDIRTIQMQGFVKDILKAYLEKDCCYVSP